MRKITVKQAFSLLGKEEYWAEFKKNYNKSTKFRSKYYQDDTHKEIWTPIRNNKLMSMARCTDPGRWQDFWSNGHESYTFLEYAQPKEASTLAGICNLVQCKMRECNYEHY
jgi:hypothetical protein